MSRNILLVGFGDLGAKVASLLTSSGYQVIGVRRSASEVADISIITADVTNPASLQPIQHLTPDIIIYCVAAGGQSDMQYKAAYVDGLSNILKAQKDNHALKHVVFVSSTRVYGQVADAILDDNSPALPADFGGERLLEAEQLLDAQPYATTVLRLSGIYGPGRLRMIHLAQQPERWPTRNSWTNRIHRDDAAHFIHFLIEEFKPETPNILHRQFIVTDSAPVSQFEVINWLAAKMNLPQRLDVNANEALTGKRLNNQHMLATGFKLRYPSYKEGYQVLLNEIVQSINHS
jgi:nucleoside-diphosphate-sugar epimerase